MDPDPSSSSWRFLCFDNSSVQGVSVLVSLRRETSKSSGDENNQATHFRQSPDLPSTWYTNFLHDAASSGRRNRFYTMKHADTRNGMGRYVDTGVWDGIIGAWGIWDRADPLPLPPLYLPHSRFRQVAACMTRIAVKQTRASFNVTWLSWAMRHIRWIWYINCDSRRSQSGVARSNRHMIAMIEPL